MEQRVYAREQAAQPYTRPSSHANSLFRTRAIFTRELRYSEPGAPAHSNSVNMRNRGPTCGTGHSRTPDPPSHANSAIPNPGHFIRTWTRYSEPASSSGHVTAISGAWANPAHMQNSGLTCETGVYLVEQHGRFRIGPPVRMPVRRHEHCRHRALRVSDAGLQQSSGGYVPRRRGSPRVPRGGNARVAPEKMKGRWTPGSSDATYAASWRRTENEGNTNPKVTKIINTNPRV